MSIYDSTISNQFAFQLRLGVPATVLRAASYLLTAAVMVGLGAAAVRRRGRPLAALAVAIGCAWVTYYSAYSLYLGWWTAIAWVLVAAGL